LHDDEEHHGPVLNDFVEWRDESHLVLNKTKEMCIDFRKHTTPTRNQNIEIVEKYKYLGVLLGNKLQWSKCTDLQKESIETVLSQKAGIF
jgi:hypothetical protein